MSRKTRAGVPPRQLMSSKLGTISVVNQIATHLPGGGLCVSICTFYTSRASKFVLLFTDKQKKICPLLRLASSFLQSASLCL